MAATFTNNLTQDHTELTREGYQPQSSSGKEIEKNLYEIETTTRILATRWDQKQKGASITITRLLDVFEAEEDDEDFIPPTMYAYKTTLSLLRGALSLMRADFPKGSPASDGAGGIRIEWKRSSRSVRLVVPCQEGERSYIYHEDSDNYDADYQVSSAQLAHWLDELVKE